MGVSVLSNIFSNSKFAYLAVLIFIKMLSDLTIIFAERNTIVNLDRKRE
jgi:hypothetical protein